MDWLLAVAQEAGGAGEATRVVLPEIDELIFGTVAFLIFFLIMAKLVFPSMRKALKAREDAIRSELERAEQARLDAERQQEEYQRKIAEARQEADRIVREATEQAEEVRRERIARAEDEARQVVDRARQEAAGERDRVMQDLQRTMADLSMRAAEQVVQKELSDPQSQRQLVEQFISSVGTGGGTRGGG